MSSEKREGFDQVFNQVGSFGGFQILLLLSVTLQALVSWHHLSYVFLGAVPPHWCKIQELEETGWSVEQIRNISVPHSRPGSVYSWEPCTYYNLNYTNLLESSKNSFEVAYTRALSERAEISECTKWNWDLSIYHSTVVTEFDLVCHSRILVGTIQGTYMAGVLVGSLLLGSLSDQYLGRRLSTLISVLISIIGGFATAISKTYEAFVFFRFILAAGVAGSYQNSYVLLLEYTNPNWRAAFGLVGQVSFAFGYMLIALLGYFFRSWDQLQLAVSGISLILLSYYWILPESARWLAYRGEDEKAYKLLKLVARLNRKPVPDRNIIFQALRSCREDSETLEDSNLITNDLVSDIPSAALQQPQSNRESGGGGGGGCICRLVNVLKGTWLNYWKLVQTPELRKRTLLIWTLFVIVDLVYYGVVFDSATLTSDPFLIVFLAGLMEVPAYTLVVPCLTSLGRRPTVIGTFILTALCSFIVAYAPVEYELFRVMVSMSGKLFITTCFAVLYLLGAELFPTATRTTGLASAVIMGRLGSILAPFVVDMMKTVYRDMPNIIFGMVSLAAGVFAIFLPETRDSEMYDEIKDLEKAAKVKKHGFSSPSRRISIISAKSNSLDHSTVTNGLLANGHCDKDVS